MSRRPGPAPITWGAALMGLLVYGLGIGWTLGGRACQGCARDPLQAA
jgi:hypothetical protein